MLVDKKLLKNLINLAIYNNEKWITIKPHGDDSDDYRRLKLEDGETPKEAIDRVYKHKETPQKEQKEATIKISKAENTKEAENFAKENNLADNIYYGTLDVSVCNEINNSLLETYKEFPKVREMNVQIGSSQEINKERYKEAFEKKGKEIADRIREMEKQFSLDKSDIEVEKFVQREVKKRIEKEINLISNKGTLGHFTFSPPSESGISFDGTKFNKNKMKTTLIDKELSIKMSKWHPIGTEGAKGTIQHEIGHSIDYYIQKHDFTKNKSYMKLMDFYKDFYKNKKNGHEEIINGLSKYATANFGEFVAEGWAEYKCSEKPREIALQIGKLLTEAYRECK